MAKWTGGGGGWGDGGLAVGLLVLVIIHETVEDFTTAEPLAVSVI